MTPPRKPAGAGTMDPALVLADETFLDVLSQVIADAFFDLPVSRWLVPAETARREIFPSYFQLLLEHALARGIVHATTDLDGVALWMPAGEKPAAPPGGYGARLIAATGPWVGRFLVFDTELHRRHPAGTPHHYLAILAVRPDRQGRGIGTALLRAHHALLDRDGIPAYLEASSMRARRLYLAHGYAGHGGPLFLPGSAVMFPMLRQPRAGEQPPETAPGLLTASAGQEPAPGGAR